MPRDRVLPETDGPFVESGDRPLLPGETGEVVAHLSKAWGEAAASVSDRLAENLRILGRLAGSDRQLPDEVA